MDHSKTTDKYYDHNPEWNIRKDRDYPIWGRNADINYQLAIRHLSAYLDSIQTVLDVGCGAGRFGTHLHKAGLRYTGVDASDVAIELGQRHYPDLELITLDAALTSSTVLSQRTFDLVTSLNALHCLVTPEHRHTFWDFCWNQLSPGGLLYVTCMGGPVSEGARASKTPRAYLSQAELMEEVAQLNGNIEWSLWMPAGGKNPIPNWYVIARKM